MTDISTCCLNLRELYTYTTFTHTHIQPEPELDDCPYPVEEIMPSSRSQEETPKHTQWLQSSGFDFTCHEVTREAGPEAPPFSSQSSLALDKLLDMQVDAPLVTWITNREILCVPLKSLLKVSRGPLSAMNNASHRLHAKLGSYQSTFSRRLKPQRSTT